MKNVILFISMSMFTLLTACGTVSGLGSDIKGAADWTHEKMTKSSVDIGK